MKQDRIYSMLGLAMKAGKVVSGEFAVDKSIKDGSAWLVIIASDASDNTTKKFSDFSGNPLLFCRMCAIILALHRGIAQLVEYRSPKPWVAGSNPPAPAMLCGQNRSARGKQPFGKPNGGKNGRFREISPVFFVPAFF